MPFFLSDEFKLIMEEKQRKEEEQRKLQAIHGEKLATSGTLGGLSSLGGGGGGSQLYKSQFLKEKIEEQNERRKRDRKLRKPPTQTVATGKQEPTRRRKEG